MDNDLIDRIKQKVLSDPDRFDAAHSPDHMQYVDNLAVTIWEKEGGDLDIIRAIAWLHDYCVYMGRAEHVQQPALNEISAVLGEVEFPVEKRAAVLYGIEHHEKYSFSSAEVPELPLEAQIAQDADRLEAIGHRGIARNFYFTGCFKKPMGTPADFDKEYGPYDLDEAQNAFRHWKEKLFRLKGTFNTKTGEEIAEGRHQTMQNFLDGYRLECEGKA